MEIPDGKEGFAQSLAVCNVGFGLPPFKLYELAPIESTDKSRSIFYADESYGPMNFDWKQPSLGGGYSAGFREIDPKVCQPVAKNGTGMDAAQRGRNGKNYNSIVEYKNQYYFVVLVNEFSSWRLNVGTVTPNPGRKLCHWSSVASKSKMPN